MSHGHYPDLDLHVISEDLEELLEAGSTDLRDDEVVIETEGPSFYIFFLGEPCEQTKQIPEVVDRLLIAVQTGFLEFHGEDILLYELGENYDYGELIRQALTGEAVHVELESEETSGTLSEAGYVHGYTSQAIVETLTGWAITSESDSVLGFAIGSGTLLKQAVTYLDKEGRLTGVEIHPLIAKLIKSRVRGIDNAEIFNGDFFDWRTFEQLELGEETQGEHSSEKYDAVVEDPPIADSLPSEQREKISEWTRGRRPSLVAAFVIKAVTHLKDDGCDAFALPKKVLKDGLLEQLIESCSIHRIAELSLGVFADAHSVGLVVLTMAKEERDP